MIRHLVNQVPRPAFPPGTQAIYRKPSIMPIILPQHREQSFDFGTIGVAGNKIPQPD